MDDTPADRFRRVNATFTEQMADIDADGWQRTSPCEGWVTRDVVAHLVEWVPGLFGGAGVPFGEVPSVQDDPAAAWTSVSASLERALDDPALASHRFPAGPAGEVSVEEAIDRFVTPDVMVHTWDIAQATGRAVRFDERVAASMLSGMAAMDEMMRASGMFGPKVPVPDDADVQAKLLGFSGRDPFRRS
jgi:uncharacterized protein (TIGR03086 family)